ncbi:MAG: GNAT family N-acetyltransferase [Solirubrobacteraceae bacterium]|jgi:predicted acetyltransferase
MSSDRLLLRPPTAQDQRAVLDAHRELAREDFEFALGYEDGMSWDQYLERLHDERFGLRLAEDRVPSTFLLADVAGEIVGRISVRHRLNDFLAHEGGHIGFAVRPGYRRRGYATAILEQGLAIAASLRIDRVLLTCEEGNAGFSAVIEACGGVFDEVVSGRRGSQVRRYWIDLAQPPSPG